MAQMTYCVKHLQEQDFNLLYEDGTDVITLDKKKCEMCLDGKA